MRRYAAAGGAIIRATTKIEPTASNAPTAVGRHKGHEAVVDQRWREPESVGKAGVEGGELEFLEEDRDDDEVRGKECPHQPETPRTEIRPADLNAAKGSEGDLAEKDGIQVEMDIFGEAGDQDDGDREERRKDERDGRIFLDALGPVEEFDQRYREHARRRGGTDEKRRGDILGDEEPKHDAEQDRVRDRVAHQRHPAEHEKDSRKCAAHRHDDGQKLDLDVGDRHRPYPAAGGASASNSARNPSRARAAPAVVRDHSPGRASRAQPSASSRRRLRSTPPLVLCIALSTATGCGCPVRPGC